MKICTDPSVLKVIYFLKIIVIIIKIAVPIILVVLAMIDLFKAVIASDDKEKQKAVKLLIKRVIYSLLIFFVPTIVNTLMITIGNIGESENFTDCLENATIENINKYQAEEEKKKQEEEKKKQEEEKKKQEEEKKNENSQSGTYTSSICGGKYTPKKAKSAQCSGGVYQYFESFLPDADPVAWQKFNQIRDTGSGAKYYYYKNKDLGKNGFAMDKDINKITTGTIIVYKGSSSSSVGHVQVVEANDGRGNLTIFECNTDRYKSAGCTRSSSGGKCCTHTESTSFYSNMINGKMKDYEFLAFIHILSDCSKNTTNSVNNNKTNTSIN